MLFPSSLLFLDDFSSLFHHQCQPFWNRCSPLDLPPLLSELTTGIPVTPSHPLILASSSLPSIQLHQHSRCFNQNSSSPFLNFTINGLFLHPKWAIHSSGPRHYLWEQKHQNLHFRHPMLWPPYLLSQVHFPFSRKSSALWGTPIHWFLPVHHSQPTHLTFPLPS